MSRQVTLTRHTGSDMWEPYATIDLDEESEWPTDLPEDVARLLREGIIPTELNSQDGHHYRIESM